MAVAAKFCADCSVRGLDGVVVYKNSLYCATHLERKGGHISQAVSAAAQESCAVVDASQDGQLEQERESVRAVN